MIDFLRGYPVNIGPDHVVFDVNGVGYRVFCANPYTVTGGNVDQESEVTVFIHYHVREDAVLLYGFATRMEQALFRRLIEVSGIGPRVALGMMSAASAENIVHAVTQEDISALTKLPGVGKKTAQRLLLDLKDKLDDMIHSLHGTKMETNVAVGSISYETDELVNDGWSEIREGLKTLGYSDAEAEKAIKKVEQKAKPDDSPDQLMKLALQALFSG